MFNNLPSHFEDFAALKWDQIEPYYRDLESRELTDASVAAWLTDWSRLQDISGETYARLYVATTLNTEDQAAIKQYQDFLVNIVEPAQPWEQKLKEKLLASSLNPVGFEVQLKNMRVEAEIFREANVPLFTKERELSLKYQQLIGAQTVQWEGQELTLTQLGAKALNDDDREVRQDAWEKMSERRLADRESLNSLWAEFLELRLQMAKNADFDSFRDFRWKQFGRDYTPEDCMTFHEAIEEVVVPAATRIYERQRKALGVETLRPWDLVRDNIFPPSRPPLKPFDKIDDLVGKAEGIFNKVDPALGEHFSVMIRENLLDLDNRKGKAPGGYQITYDQVKRPFIFMNAVGQHDDVQTLLHEGGHAFHAVESFRLPYSQQRNVPIEMCEVASMSMELLAAPYLKASEGGYYTDADAARARIEHLEHLILFWPFMAVVDAFQHWVYANPTHSIDPAACDAEWDQLWQRFIPGVDWSGLDAARMTGWHRKLHIFEIPFYYVDYGLAQVGAVQVWRNALHDQAGAVSQYKAALALGGTRTLPELFAAAGARFAFDAATLGELVDLVESTIGSLAKEIV